LPATVRKGHRVLSLILAMAVKDGRLARNAAAGVSLPRVVREERQYLTHTEVERLAEACAAPPGEPVSKHRRLSERRHEDYRLIVLFLPYTGVRFGELAALRVGRLDFRRRRAVIAESVILVGSRQIFGTPKSHERRDVPIPPFLVEELERHVAGRGPDELVFPGTRSGGPLRAPVFRRRGKLLLPERCPRPKPSTWTSPAGAAYPRHDQALEKVPPAGFEPAHPPPEGETDDSPTSG
jgi:integrase